MFSMLQQTQVCRPLAVRAVMSRWMSSDAAGSIKRTCLYDFHKDRQARMESFAGHSMPIVYKDQTITLEHMQCREQAAAFDVSHMMQTIIRGKDRIRFIESLTTADVAGLKVNKCALSVLSNASGGIIDDCIVGRCEDHVSMVSNAGNAEIVWAWLNENKTRELDVHLERLEGRGLIALQGPKAAGVLQELVKAIRLSDIEFMETRDTELAKGVGRCTITRCGYTGEDGFEISVEPARARTLMELLCEHADVKPAGLGARDTLRLEAGLCLHGHDITSDTTPVEAALSWVVHKRRRAEGGFPGHELILGQLKQGSRLKRLGLVAKAGGPPAREGSIVKTRAGERLGSVTSGTFAPKLGKAVAMAYLPSELAKEHGRTVVCEVRGKSFEYELAKMPFVKSNYYIKPQV